MTHQAGQLQVSASGYQPAIFNRLQDGTIADFRIDGSSVGSIFSHSSGNMGIGTGATGILFAATSNSIQPWNPSSNVARDATQDLGTSGNRFKDLHLSGQTIGGNGTAGAPTYAFGNDTDMGMYRAANNNLGFSTNGGERMRLDGSGNLLVGRSSTGSAATDNGHIFYGTGQHYIFSNATECVRFYETSGSGQQVGSISITSSATTFNTSSDQRLKENIVDALSASDDIDAIQVRSFDWKADGSHQKYGMVAQELQTVAPEAVSEGETEDDMMGVDYSKLVPMLVKEIQSLRARVAQLEGEA
jgi:hypothetical protein